MTNDELQEWLRQKFQVAYKSGRAGNSYSAIEAAASVIHDLKLVWQDNSLPATERADLLTDEEIRKLYKRWAVEMWGI